MKFFPLIISSFFLTSLMAQEVCPTPSSLTKDINNIVEKTLPECTPEDSQAFKEFSLLFPSSAPSGKKTIAGVELEGNLELLSIAEKMVLSPPLDLWKEKVSSCTKVLCAFEKLFGDRETAYTAFNIAKRNGYPLKLGSLFNGTPAQIYSAKEIKIIDEAFTIFPPELNRLKNVAGYYRLQKGLATKGTESAAAWASSGYNNDAKVVFQDGTFDSDDEFTRQTVTHETCHHYDYQTLYTDGKRRVDKPSYGFNELSGWKKVTTASGTLQWQADTQAKFVTDYAGTQPGEDFAESCAFYVNNPEELKAKAPLKYTFMKDKVFGGKEFPGFKSPEEIIPFLEDQEICADYLGSCLKIMDIQDDCKVYVTSEKNAMQLYSMSGESFNWILDHSCYKNARVPQKTKIKLLLAQNKEVYCKNGGEKGIETVLDNKLCKKSLNEGLNLCKKQKQNPKILADAKASCALKKDNSKKCLMDYFEANKSFDLKTLGPKAREAFYKKVLGL